MTISSQICKRIYQADGTTRQWAVDFPYISTTELKVICTDEAGEETDVTAQCIFDEIEQAVIYPTVASGKDPIPTGNTLTIIRVTTPTQTLHLTQQGTLDATALEKGFDKLTLQVQELQEQSRRSIKYPVSSTKSEADAQTFLNELQAAQRNVLNGTLENVRTITHDLVQAVEGETASRIEEDAALQEAILTKQNTLSLPQQDAVNSKITAARVSSYDAHLLDNKNPHNVSKMQVGLGNVDNTADMDKPVSHAMQTALNQKQPTLTNAQLEAVNSGVTQEIISQVQSNQAELASMAEELDEDRPWQKPADWVDIRSGALDNSVYMLVGHSADYSLYPELVVRGQVSTSSNTYDVYVDGEKVATTASGTETTLNWQTLALETGFDVSYPINLRTHVVRITPTVDTDTLSGVSIVSASASVPRGVLWFHYELSNQINIRNAFQRCPYLEAVTAKDDVIKLYDNGSVNYGIAYFIRSSGVLAPRGVLHLPVLEGTNSTSGVNTYAAFMGAKVSDCVIRYRNCIILNSADVDYGWTAKEVQTENAQVGFGAVMRGPSITKFPPLYIGGQSALPGPVTNLPNLEPTILDLSANTSVERLRINGTSTVRMDGLKGLIVPKEAPYTGSSPQIDVRYTGLDRVALRQMFRSMPTVSASQVCNITGATGANDLTAEDLAIATEKGWSVVR